MCASDAHQLSPSGLSFLEKKANTMWIDSRSGNVSVIYTQLLSDMYLFSHSLVLVVINGLDICALCVRVHAPHLSSSLNIRE